jgi:predicted alpha/beta-hydrolase family hydrolase
MTAVTEHTFRATRSSGDVSAILMRPASATALYVFAHGAGAGMRHRFMERVASRLGDQGVATLRYHFPYMEAGRKGPNPASVLTKTVRSAVTEASRLAPDLPLVAGGKSMGGRMTSLAAASESLPAVRGLAFFGFPLHAPGRPSSERGTHLAGIGLPTLFLQGTRDKLADLELLEPLLETISPRPMLHVAEGADHSFHVLKRSGRTDEEVLDEICGVFQQWLSGVV